MRGDSPRLDSREEVICTLTVPFALLNLHVEVPTAIAPPEGFETKMKQVLSQAGAITQKNSTVKRPRCCLVLGVLHWWRIAAPPTPHYNPSRKKEVIHVTGVESNSGDTSTNS